MVAAPSAAVGTPHDKDAFVATMEMNAFGTFNVTRLGAAAMADNEPDDDGQRGVIVNTGSIAGIEGQTGQIAYGGGQGGDPRHDAADGARPGARSASGCARSPPAPWARR